MKTQRNKYMGKYVPQIMKGLWIKLKNWHAQETCNSQAVFQQTCNRTHNWSTLYQGKLTSTPSTSHTWGSSTKRKAAAMDYTILVLGPTYGGYLWRLFPFYTISIPMNKPNRTPECITGCRKLRVSLKFAWRNRLGHDELPVSSEYWFIVMVFIVVNRL